MENIIMQVLIPILVIILRSKYLAFTKKELVVCIGLYLALQLTLFLLLH